MSAIIDIEAIHRTAKAQMYRVWHDGSVLIESCKSPEHDAARKLSAMGVTGRMQTRRLGQSRVDMEMLIAVAAAKTVSETQKHGPRVVRWAAFDDRASDDD